MNTLITRGVATRVLRHSAAAFLVERRPDVALIDSRTSGRQRPLQVFAAQRRLDEGRCRVQAAPQSPAIPLLQRSCPVQTGQGLAGGEPEACAQPGRELR
jgi:hypothetical protein